MECNLLSGIGATVSYIRGTDFTCNQLISKEPHFGEISEKGVEILLSQPFNIGVALPLNSILNGVLNQNTNVYDNQRYCIYANQSNISVYNSKFQSTYPSAASPNPNSYGVYAIGNTNTPGNLVTIGGTDEQANIFNYCKTAINLQTGYGADITNNIFDNLTYGGGTGLYASKCYGTIFVPFPYTIPLSINFHDNNRVSNFTYGVRAYNNPYTIITINNNAFDNCTIGNYFLNPQQFSLCLANISNNTFDQVRTGINMYKYVNPRLYNNDISLAQTAGGENGISLTDCFRPNVEYNSVNTNSASTFGEPGSIGINVYRTPRGFYCHNVLTKCEQGMRYRGACTDSRLIRNVMQSGTYGFVLKDASALVGPQGYAPTATDAGEQNGNRWCGFSFPLGNYHTLNDGVPTPVLFGSIFTVQNANPIGCQLLPTYAGDYNSPATYPVIFNTFPSTDLQTIDCGTVPSDEHHNDRSAQFIDTTWVDMDSSGYIESEEYIQNVERMFNRNEAAYLIAMRDSGITDIVLLLLADSLRHTNIGLIERIRGYMRQAAFTPDSATLANLQTTLDSLQGTLQMEVNERLVAQVYLDWYVREFPYTDSVRNLLLSVATQCPESGGSAVYEARALLYLRDTVYAQYTDSCESNPAPGLRLDQSDDLPVAVLVYPNPANDVVIVEAFNAVGNLEVYDALGKRVFETAVGVNGNYLQVNIRGWTKGLYLFKVSSSDGRCVLSKVSVN